MSVEPLIDVRGVSVSYGLTQAVRGCDLQLRRGERVAVMGVSGSGKSTLLHCLAGILTPSSGEVWFEGARIDSLSEPRRSELRLQRMGVVFQYGDLVPELTVEENVMLPLLLHRTKWALARRRAHSVLERLGIADVAERRPGTVSGGQAQRAAVARAIVHEPAVIFADEPTGSLDTVSAEIVLDALIDVAEAESAALVVVTHDHQVAAHLDRLVFLRDGRVIDQRVAVR